MKILIFGAGALGSFFGALLAKRCDVLLYGRKKHMRKIATECLKIAGRTNLSVKLKTTYNLEDLQDSSFDLIILTVKAYDTETAVEELFSVVGGKNYILSLQNGIGNLEKIAVRFPVEYVLGGITAHGVTYLEEGHVFHAGVGKTVIGFYNGMINNVLENIATTFTSVGIKTGITANIIGEIWAKAIVNSCINPLTAIAKVENGALLKNPYFSAILEKVCKEGIKVAMKKNIKLPSYNILEVTKKVIMDTSDNKSSMLQDLEKGKRTEIDYINGRICEVGKELGIETPYNTLLRELVKAFEYRKR